MKKALLVTLLIICSFNLPAQAQVAPEKRAEIEKMLQVMGMEKTMTLMMTQMLGNFKKAMPDTPAEVWTKMEKKMDVHELIEKIIPVYDKYYTLDDLKAVNAFYSSPTGKKIISTLPQVMQESMQIGREWGERIGKEAAEEAQAESQKK
jgi:hypothetical protein